MGICGSLNVRQSAVVKGLTDRDLRHGPVACYCYTPCINTVDVIDMTELKMFEYALLEDTRDPSQTKYVYGPLLVRLDNPYQRLESPQKVPVLDQNDYIVVIDRTGVKRTVPGPAVFQPVYGERWSEVKEAVVLQMNEFVVIKDGADRITPIRHLRGPTKYYPQPYDELIADEKTKTVRHCIEVNDTQAIWLKRPDGRLYLIDKPQFLMPEVGEALDRVVMKTILKESEFCIIISPTGENILKTGKNEKDRAFFLPPYYTFLKFVLGRDDKNNEVAFDRFSTLPTYIPNNFLIRTADNVVVRLDLRISFSIFQPELYVVKPIDFYNQIRYWIQNEMLDAYAKCTFRDFQKTYADLSITATERSRPFFGEFGIQVIDVQVINFVCEDVKTQELLELDIITNVKKQNELRAKETDVEIMKREKAVKMEQKDIEYQYSLKENEMALKKKELDISLRTKEVELQVAEEKRRTELMEVKRQNAVKEGLYEGQAQGESVRAFFEALPSTLSSETKMNVWMTLRDMERSAMLYSKVSDITIYPPGADIKKFEMRIDEGGKKMLAQQPLLLPSILGYSADQNTATTTAGAIVGSAAFDASTTAASTSYSRPKAPKA